MLPDGRDGGNAHLPDVQGDKRGTILVINAGSSSIRFAVYANHDDLQCFVDGKIDRLETRNATLAFRDRSRHCGGEEAVAAHDHVEGAEALIDWLQRAGSLDPVVALGHRVVHGMERIDPEIVDDALLAHLRGLECIDPDHVPSELALIEAFRRHRPDRPQYVCYDTAFHRTMPSIATLLALPRRYVAEGVRRYGFHGLSCAYLIEELARLAGEEAARGRVVIAHLGGGASVTALRAARSVDTSMGFTPTAGLPMGTRSGDLDPGVAGYLQRKEGMTLAGYARMVDKESGLLGISGTSGDMRELLASEDRDPHAAEAVAFFVYQTRKWIGGYAAVLGGLETLVFAGGIGERAAIVRARICEGLEFLGVRLDPLRNEMQEGVISRDDSGVLVRVIPSNEEVMIARSVRSLVGHPVAVPL